MPGDSGSPPLDALDEHLTGFETDDGLNADGVQSDVLGDDAAAATVVGIGEPVHGVRDCHVLQRRIVQHLVRERGLRAVALETNHSEAAAIDAYVVDGDGSDAAGALAALSMWVWQTEGWRDLVEWLREFNRDRPVDDRVRFYGVDVQRTTAAAARVDDYLERVDPAFCDANAEGLDLLRTGVRPGNRDDESEPPADDVLDERIERAAAAVDAIESRFEGHRDRYVAATDEPAYAVARSHAAQLRPAVDLARIAHEEGAGRAYGVRRDAAMAENVERVLDRDDHDAIAVIAANGHLRKGNDHHENPGEGGPLGYHLDDAFGDDYYALATEFHTGSVRTLDVHDADETHSFPAQDLDEPPSDSVMGVLEDGSEVPAVLDLDAAAETPGVAAWLSTTDSHGFAPRFDDERDAGLAGDWRVDYSWEMDALCFVPEVEAARLLDFVTGDAN